MGICISSNSSSKVVSHSQEKVGKRSSRISRKSSSLSTSDGYDLSFSERYTWGDKCIGQGADAKVLEGIDRVTNEKTAVKVMRWGDSNRREEILRRFNHEVKALSHLHHRGIIQMHDYCREKEQGVIVLEYAEGGDLFDRLANKGRLSESEAGPLMYSIVEAVKYLHSRNYVHRDLKPENILLRSRTTKRHVMITDFGFSTKCNGNHLTEFLGTLSYMAPEVLRELPYGKAVDVWALGVILFAMLSGNFPFFHDDKQVMFECIVYGLYSFSDNKEVWSQISLEAKDLIKKILVVDPEKRCSIQDMLNHPWLRKYRLVKDPEDIQDEFYEIRLDDMNG